MSGMKPFRFGIVAGYAPDLTSWTAQAERVEKLGFDTLLATEAEAQSIVDRFRTLAGPRLPEIELSLNLMAVGDEPSPGIARFAGVDVPELAAAGAVTVLPADPGQAADKLLRWREQWGISYVTINSG